MRVGGWVGVEVGTGTGAGCEFEALARWLWGSDRSLPAPSRGRAPRSRRVQTHGEGVGKGLLQGIHHLPRHAAPALRLHLLPRLVPKPAAAERCNTRVGCASAVACSACSLAAVSVHRAQLASWHQAATACRHPHSPVRHQLLHVSPADLIHARPPVRERGREGAAGRPGRRGSGASADCQSDALCLL